MPRKLLFAILSVASLTFVLGIGTIYFFFFRQPTQTPSLEIQSPFVDANIPIVTPTPTPRPAEVVPTPTATPKPAAKQTSSADTAAAKISALEIKIKELEDKLTALEKTSTTKTTTTTQVIESQAKEFYIYLGSGASTDRNWTDIGAASGFVDTSNYGNIKSVSFEAAMSIVGGETHARLKNKTTGEIYYETEISHNTGTSTWKKSSSFPLTSGSNEYVVQVRSTSGEQARLDGSRIKILVQ